MIDRLHGRMVIACDGCGRLSEGDSNEWVEVWLQAKREGGRRARSARNGCQFCGEACASKLAGDQIRQRH
jgi:hypothetical protein